MSAPNIPLDQLPDDQQNQNQPPTQNQNDPPAWAMQYAQQQEYERIQRENLELRQRLERQSQQQIPAPGSDLAPGEPFNNPQKFLGAIDELIQRQVAPLRQTQEQYARQLQYQQLKNRVKVQYPQFAQTFQSIEHLVDNEMAQQDPTEANLMAALQRVVGGVVLSNPQAFFQGQQRQTPQNQNQPPANNNQPANNQNNQQVPPQLPPHLSSSRPIIDGSQNQQNGGQVDMSQFNENEIRLMRERGLNAKQWIALRDTPPDKLTKAKWEEIKNLK